MRYCFEYQIFFGDEIGCLFNANTFLRQTYFHQKEKQDNHFILKTGKNKICILFPWYVHLPYVYCFSLITFVFAYHLPLIYSDICNPIEYQIREK